MRSDAEASTDEGSSEVQAPAPSKPSETSSPSDKYGKGVIFYLREGRVVGLLMWNMFGRMNLARKVIREHRQYEDLTELAKLFNIHGQDQ